MSTNALFRRALRLATLGRNLAPPNPSVGCVICTSGGEILGEGHTQGVGGPHAEIVAMRQALERGHSLAGATAYVSLEPCSHHGRTGPCCDALIAAGIAKVFAICCDPNPKVAGQGFARLRAAGIEVHTLAPDDTLVTQAIELNIGFFSRMLRGTPWVRMKMASSLDGRTALNNGASQWITSTQSRLDGHALRARACAILTGIGTVAADDPQLDVRLVETRRQPHVVVADSRLQTPPNARLFKQMRCRYIYAAETDAQRQSLLEAQGARVVYCPGQPDGFKDKVDLAKMMRDMAAREINEVHVEAGHRLNGALFRGSLVDEVVAYVAPKLIGEGRGMVDWGPVDDLTGALTLRLQHISRIGPDIRIVARPEGVDHSFLSSLQ